MTYSNPELEEQRCTKCREIKPFEEFPPDQMVSTGLSSWCRSCHRAATQAWREKKRAQIAAKAAR
jgi:hypothetical protein